MRAPRSFVTPRFRRLDRPLWLASGEGIPSPKLWSESLPSPWDTAIASMSAAYQGHPISCSQVKRRPCLFTDVFGIDISVVRVPRHPRLDRLIGQQSLLQTLRGTAESNASCEEPAG